MDQSPTRAMQDYLKAIHGLGGTDVVVSTVELANSLEVRAASVTAMLKRLAQSGWIKYAPGQGARLTQLGTSEARRVIRRHRLMELFLTRVLGLDWSEVDAEAETLEHAISPRLEQAIADYLGEPLEDPHGHPIPTRGGEIAVRNLRPLHSFNAGQVVVIREVQDEHPGRLRRWFDLGLTPGATVVMCGRHELDGTFEFKVRDHVVTLAAEGLSGVLAEAIAEQGMPDAGKTKKVGRPPKDKQSKEC